MASLERTLLDKMPETEKCVELCFNCLERAPGTVCDVHPLRKMFSTRINCFSDDEFKLIDFSETPSSEDSKADDLQAMTFVNFAKKFLSELLPTPESEKKKKKKEAEKMQHHMNFQELSLSEVPRKKFSRFREKKYVCDVCEAMFTMKQNVAHHLFLFHVQNDGTMKKSDKTVLKCSECSQIFRSTNAADLHYKKKHAPKKSANKVPSDCDKCGKTFASAFQLKEHVAIQHLNERNFKCEDCSQAFGRRGGLRRHIQMVHQNHLHRCPYEGCDHPGYKCSKALTAHIRSVHTNVRPFVCPDCGKAFVRKNDLKMHQLTHQKDLLYTCECGGNFRRQMYLRKHRKNCELTKRRQQEAGTSESPEELETETTEEHKPSSSPE